MKPGRAFLERRGPAERQYRGERSSGNREGAIEGDPVTRGNVGLLSYRIVKRRDRRFRVFRTRRFVFDITFSLRRVQRRNVLLLDCLGAVTRALYRLLNYLREEYRGDEFADVQFTILSQHLDTAINMRPHPLHGLRNGSDAVSAIMYALEELIQSEPEIPLDNTFEVMAVVTSLPPVQIGAGEKKKKKKKRVELGENFGHPSLTSSDRYLRFPPDYEGELQNCCFLTSLRLGIAHIAELKMIRESKRKRIPKTPLSRDWRILRYLNLSNEKSARRKRAERHLERLTLEMCRKHRLNPIELSLANLDTVRHTVDQMSVNVDIYSNEAGSDKVFSHPHRHDRTLPTVNLFLARHPSTHILHCGVLTRPSKFLSKKKMQSCEFCRRSYTTYYIKFHKCKARDTCRFCRRVYSKSSDHLDFETREKFCDSKRSHPEAMLDYKCVSCGLREFTTQDCFSTHIRFCRSLEKCEKCEKVYQRRNNGKYKHRCGDVFCVTCKKFYNSFCEEKHHCAMTRPGQQKEWVRMGFFDFETRTDENDCHIVNAVGVSYETTPGKFREVCYYDDELEHPKDGLENDEDETVFRYWPERIATPPLIKKPKRIRRMKEVVVDMKKKRRNGDLFFDEAQEVDSEDDNDDDDDEEEEEESSKDWQQDDEDIIPGSALHKFVTRFVSEDFFGFCFLAHNFSRFDGLLLLNYLIKRMKLRVEPLFEGQKLLHLKVPELKITFVDSYRYIKMSLTKFPERFPDLEKEIGFKGTFPYRFNDPKNYGYEGTVPGEEWFLDKFSTPSEIRNIRRFREKFEDEGRPYNFNEELDKYLRQDVRLLRGACLHQLKENFDFQEELARDAEIPFHCFSKPFFTGSSFAHGIFRFYSLRENELFLLDNQTGGRKTSKLEMEWLEFEAHRQNVYIRHAYNHPDGQKRLRRYYLDGYHKKSNTAYEFLGCAIHGHVLEDRNCPLSKGMTAASPNPYGRRVEEMWKDWNKKVEILKADGVKIRTMWECSYMAKKESDEELISFLKYEYYQNGRRPTERLAVRTGLRGGRTEAFRLFYRWLLNNARMVLYYVDKNSLYPDVAIRKDFPTGIPLIFIGPKLEEIGLSPEQTFFLKTKGCRVMGMIQATVLPPDSLFLPILPTNISGKLKFGLCHKCLETEQKSWCKHRDEERAILDTWTTIEVEHALKCGYRLVQIHEMVVYTTSAPIFREHYMRLAKMKLESEGFPSDDMSMEEKRQYVKKINAEMPGLELDVQRIKKNRPRRQFAKDMSNIGLGKMSQSDLRQKSEYVYSWYRLSELKYSSSVNLVRVNPINETCAEAIFTPKEERLGFARNTQSVVYAFVTAYARIDMLDDMRTLQKMGAKIFYMDTDSIIMSFPEDGDFETLKKKFRFGSSAYGAYKFETSSQIVSFVACGPKNYSYRTKDGEEVVKVRGFTLKNRQALDTLNNSTMTELLQSWLRGKIEEVRTVNFSMKLDRVGLSVRNSTLTKRYRNDNFDKRYVPQRDIVSEDENVTTYPFGCKHNNFEDV